eukprot:c26504_g1_i1 orf=215-490(-)
MSSWYKAQKLKIIHLEMELEKFLLLEREIYSQIQNAQGKLSFVCKQLDALVQDGGEEIDSAECENVATVDVCKSILTQAYHTNLDSLDRSL